MRNNLQLNTTNTDFIKIYPDFIKFYKYKTQEKSYIQKKSVPQKKSITPECGFEGDDSLYLERSVRRSRTILSDLVLCNEFDMFATFTFKSDRDNIQKSKDKMSQWLQSQQKISKFRYLIVAEYHKDKKAIHFHALLGGYKGKLTEAKNKKTGKIIYNKHGNVRYNINSYHSGYTTLDLIQTTKAKKLVSSYIRKYISKDMILDASKQRYWCSQNLNRPKITKAKYYDNQLQLGALQLVYENDIFQLYESSDKIETLFNKKAQQWQTSQLTTQLKVKLRTKSTSSTWTHDSLKPKTVEPSITFD